MIKRIRRAVVVLLLISTASASTGATAEDDIGGIDIAHFLQTVDELRRQARIPGLSIAVVKDQQLVLAAGLGLADVETGAPASADTPYDIASVSKPISAVVAMRLVEAGVIDLDRPLSEYSAWLEFCTQFSQQTSIFANNIDCESREHSLRHLLSHTGAGDPGSEFSYNPVLYSWASRPMMSVTGSTFSALVERYVLQPASMTHSARRYRDLPLREDLAKTIAPPHRIDNEDRIVRAPDLSPQGDGAAGGVVSTVVDLAKFDIALDQDELISAQSRAEMFSATKSQEGVELPYGVGWYVQELDGRTLLWHSGWWEDAYSALYLKVPASNTSLIALANSEGLWWGNPLTEAQVEQSPFAQAFLSTFVDP